MAYDVNVPVATQSPTVFPAQSVENFTRLKTLITADHQFNDATAANDGYHKVEHFVNQGGAYGDNTPASLGTSTGQMYTKTVNGSEHLCYHQDTSSTAANEVCLTVAPIRAAIAFNSAGTVEGTAFNATVARTAPGNYTISFTPGPLVPMPSANYIVSLQPRNPTEALKISYTKTTTTVVIQVTNSASTSFIDVAFDFMAVGG